MVPQPFSRVFSPLARYKLYENRDDNANWEIDFDRPRHHVWDYVWRSYGRTRHIGNFDFMRGDMSHVQMRPDGVPNDVDEFYDILGSVKLHVQRTQGAPWFGYFAETFLPARDVFGFGEEQDHLEASLADATLGDLQSCVVGSPDFLRQLRRYLDDLVTRRCAPSFTVMTADKDDPRFDEFYVAGNEARMFTALFLTDMPSYVGLGFEIRDVHLEPVENERYTKLFVFKEVGESNRYPSKARFGERFVWGENVDGGEDPPDLRLRDMAGRPVMRPAFLHFDEDHLVAGAHARCQQREVQTGCARVDCHGFRGADVPRERRLECLHAGSRREPSRLDHVGDGHDLRIAHGGTRERHEGRARLSEVPCRHCRGVQTVTSWPRASTCARPAARRPPHASSAAAMSRSSASDARTQSSLTVARSIAPAACSTATMSSRSQSCPASPACRAHRSAV